MSTSEQNRPATWLRILWIFIAQCCLSVFHLPHAHSSVLQHPRAHFGAVNQNLFPQSKSSVVFVPPTAQALSLQEEVNLFSEGYTLKLPKDRTFFFNSVAFNISAKKHITLEGNGAVLSFHGAAGRGVEITNCVNVTLTGFSIVYSTPINSQGRITGTEVRHDAGSASYFVTMEVDSESDFMLPPDPAIWGSCFYPQCETKVVFFDGDRMDMLQPQVVEWLTSSTKINDTHYELGLAFGSQFQQPTRGDSGFGVGTSVVVCSRYGSGAAYHVKYSEGIHTSDLKIHGATNMAILELGGAGSNTYDRIRVERHPNTALKQMLVTNFDGFHSEGAVHAPTLQNSYFEHIGDDFFNFQNGASIVLHNFGNNTILVADASFNSTYGPVLPMGTAISFYQPTTDVWINDRIALAQVRASRMLAEQEASTWEDIISLINPSLQTNYKWSLSGFQSTGFQVWAVDVDELAYDLDSALGLESSINPTYTKGAESTKNTKKKQHTNAAMNANTLIKYAHFAQVHTMSGGVVQNNRFVDGASRCGPMNAFNSVVRGNYFENTKMGGILVSAEITWLSGNLGLRNVSIENNIFNKTCSNFMANFPYIQCTNSVLPVFNPAGSKNVTDLNNLIIV